MDGTGAEPREGLLALIPHLRAFARTLEPDPGAADALVVAALVGVLDDRRPAASADGPRARAKAMIEASAAGDGPAGDVSVQPAAT